ncbi:MAG: hypothetical protein H0W46_08065, partial [Acidimicrobiia bacterium]|nr:hypothetical protein [Acidimicrobiia bacterium]
RQAMPVDVLADRLRAPAPLPELPELRPLARRPTGADEFTDVLVSALAALAGGP